MPTHSLNAMSAGTARAAGFGQRRGPHRRPGVSRYRVFMLVVFCAIVAADAYASRCQVAGVADAVGATTMVLWILTLLGSFGLGPVGLLRDSWARR